MHTYNYRKMFRSCETHSFFFFLIFFFHIDAEKCETVKVASTTYATTKFCALDFAFAIADAIDVHMHIYLPA